MWRLMWKNLLRNKRRTLLTASSVAVSLFLLSSLAMVYTALGRPLTSAESIPLLIVHHACGIVVPLPVSYEPRIKAVPGVAAVSRVNFFGGHWKDPANTFANFAVDANTVFDVLHEVFIAPDQLDAFKHERVAAVTGKRLAEKYGWKIGDRITLLGSPYGITPEVVLRGIFTGGREDHFYFHWDYLNEAVGRPDWVGLYWVRIERPEMASRVGQAIDQIFRSTDAETRTESVGTFLLYFISMLGNVRAIILMVGSAVTFAILLIIANTMAMSIRERTGEAAVLRSLGFRSEHILRLFVGESLALTLAGALLGVGGAKLLYDRLALWQVGEGAFADLRLRPETLVLMTVLGLLIGLLAVGWPAYRTAKAKLGDALRFVG